MENDLLSLNEVMKLLRARHSTVLKMIARGQLTPIPWGQHPKFRREDVEKILNGEIPGDDD